MKDAPARQLPGTLLIAITAVVAICGLPSAMMFLVAGIPGGSAHVSLVLGAPALIAYAVAVWLSFLARHQGPGGRGYSPPASPR